MLGRASLEARPVGVVSVSFFSSVMMRCELSEDGLRCVQDAGRKRVDSC
jgi:hypothetical protein